MWIALDTGGTFTDCLGRTAAGGWVQAKVPSTPQDPVQAILQGIRLLQVQADGEVVERIVHGSTIATNALLEGTGGSAALIVPWGFEDLLLLGRQTRPELYTLEPRLLPLALPRERVLGVPARTSADGTVLEHWDTDDLTELMKQLQAIPHLSAVGICLFHAPRFPLLEQALREMLRASGLAPAIAICCSHELSADEGEYERAVTTALNARLLAPVGGYLQRLAAAVAVECPEARLEIALSNGDTLPAAEAAQVPVRMLLSGPAGGVQLGWQLAQQAGQPVITLDIGGTSADVACIPGEPLQRSSRMAAGYPVRTPMLDIETVGAGGGSLLWLDAGGALQVGPQSAGADPGPACYGLGMLPTLTDAHLLLGHLPFDLRLGGSLRIDVERARASLAPLSAVTSLSIEDLARGAIAIADQRIATAIRAISSARGIDPGQCALAILGGAGGLHAAGVAALLGITTLLLPPHPGLGSAHGLAACGVTLRQRRSVDLTPADEPALREILDSLLFNCFTDWKRIERGREPVLGFAASLRYQGQDAALSLDAEPLVSLRERFTAMHAARFGFTDEAGAIEVVQLEASLREPRDPWPLESTSVAGEPPLQAAYPVQWRPALEPGTQLDGPCLLVEPDATTLIPAGATAQVQPDGVIRISLVPAVHPSHGELDAIGLTLAQDLLASVTEEMAQALELSAHSSNIKDRRDLSTALFDGEGRLLAQGAHIPVHLGSMETSVTAVRKALALQPGQSAIVNSPYHGGTHLPDLTIVTAVGLGVAGIGFVASRAHHADIGGSAPGSMPLTDNAADEGMLIPPTLLADAQGLRQDVIRWICEASRQPAERRGDLLAQLGANQRGVDHLLALVEAQGAAWYQTAAPALLAYSGAMVQSALATWEPGTHTALVMLESDGLGTAQIPVQATVTLSGPPGARRLILDFAGTAGAVRGPLNCPQAVAQAAVAYVIRCLAPAATPANAGLLHAVSLHIPPGCLLDAQAPSPTAAGNVETSQKIVQVLLAALRPLVPGGIAAPSQGTMNNLLIGGTDPRTGTPFTYYETLAGGAGAGPLGPGASAVHTHMTNSRNTPIELLERRYPMRIVSYQVRPGSAGQPRSPSGFPGGDGVLRGYQFLTDVTLTLIADWPESSEPLAGKRGAAWLLHADDSLEPLPSKVSRTVAEGTVLLLATPGGWAWEH